MRFLLPAMLALCACTSASPPETLLVIESPDFG